MDLMDLSDFNSGSIHYDNWVFKVSKLGRFYHYFR